MFILIPFSSIIISFLFIAIIIYRKRSYLHKLTLLEAGESSNGSYNGTKFYWGEFCKDFFPELDNLLNKMDFECHKTALLKELEKILRKIRLFFLKIDGVSSSLIGKIRKSHINSKLNKDIKDDAWRIDSRTASESPNIETPAAKSYEFLKNEEQRLIIEIAQNPKNYSLYESIGDLYVEMENFNDAKESYEAAIELNPNEESLKIKLSKSLEKVPK